MQQQTVTQLLNRAAASGDGNTGSAAADLLPIVYEELRSLAASFFRDQKSGNTLQPTALVHEAYLKLVDQSINWQSRRHFFAVAASAMRSILVDHARRRNAAKRGGDRKRVPLAQADVTPALRGVGFGGAGGAGPGSPLDESTILAIDEAITRLAALDSRKAELVELRFFAGLSSEEAADALGIARSTAAEEWRTARAWLYSELKEEST